MEEYKKTVKTRMQYEFIFGIILIPLAVLTLIHFLRLEPVIYGSAVKDFIGGFFNGVRAPLVAAFSFYLFSLYYRDHKAWKNEKTLKEMCVEEHDERMKMIRQQASTRANFITMYVLMVAAIIAGWFNALVSITLLIVWCFMAVVTIVTKNIYEARM